MEITIDKSSLQGFNIQSDLLYLEGGTTLKAKGKGWFFFGWLARGILRLRGDIYNLDAIKKRILENGSEPVKKEAHEILNSCLIGESDKVKKIRERLLTPLLRPPTLDTTHPAVAQTTTTAVTDDPQKLRTSLQTIDKYVSHCPWGITSLSDHCLIIKRGTPENATICLHIKGEFFEFSLNNPEPVKDKIELIHSIATALNSCELPFVSKQQDETATQIHDQLLKTYTITSTSITRKGSGYIMRYDTLPFSFPIPAEWQPVFLDEAKNLQLQNAFLIPDTYVTQFLSVSPKPPAPVSPPVAPQAPSAQGAPTAQQVQASPSAVTATPQTPVRSIQVSQILEGKQEQFEPLSTLTREIILLKKSNPDTFREELLKKVSGPLHDKLSSSPSHELQEQIEKLAAVELSLKQRYRSEWGDFGWHGGSSFQRIIFQDKEFAAHFANPLFIKALLYRLCNDSYTKPPTFSGPLTFPEIVFMGLAENSLDFLLSASPHWCNLPTIPGFTWKLTVLGERFKEQKPLEQSESRVTDIQNVLSGLTALQETLFGSKPADEDVMLLQSIDRANVQQLQRLLRGAVTKAHQTDLQRKEQSKEAIPVDELCLSQLIAGTTKGATLPRPMMVQSLDVLANYEDLIDPAKGNLDVATMVSYGFVSHALDGRHLLADIAHIHGQLPIEPSEHMTKGAKAMQTLWTACENGSAGPEATFLLTSRLRQAARIVLQRIQENAPIGYTMDDFKAALGLGIVQ